MDISRIAAELAENQASDCPRLLAEPFADASVEQAYAIQSECINRRLATDEKLLGYKVGCTSDSTQQQLGIAHPIFGRLFESHRTFSPQTISRDAFDGLAVEGELAVELSAMPHDIEPTPEAVQNAIHATFPVIELHHSGHTSNQQLTAPILIGNNAIHASFIQEPRSITAKSKRINRLEIWFGEKCVADLQETELQETILSSLVWLCKHLQENQVPNQVKPPVTVLCGTIAPLFQITQPVQMRVSADSERHLYCTMT